MKANSIEFDQSILPIYRQSRIFSDPGCKAADSNFFDFFWSLHSNGKTPKTKYVLAKLGDNIIPSVLCHVIQKSTQFNLPTYLVLESSDDRLPGFILGKSHRPARTLYTDSFYLEKSSYSLPTEARAVLSEYGLFGGTVHLLGLLDIVVQDNFITNTLVFSNWAKTKRSTQVLRAWGSK